MGSGAIIQFVEFRPPTFDSIVSIKHFQASLQRDLSQKLQDTQAKYDATRRRFWHDYGENRRDPDLLLSILG